MQIAQRRCFLVTIIAAAPVLTSFCYAADGPAPKWIEPSDEIVSPHIKWCKPSHDGPLRVLFITYRTAMREIVETCARFDIDREVFAISEPDLFSRGSDGDYQSNAFGGVLEEPQQLRLRQKLAQDYDVIVVGDIKWDVLPDWARVNILKKVAAGTGLVGYIQRGLDDAINDIAAARIDTSPTSLMPAFPFAGLPAFKQHADFEQFAHSTIHHARHGRGRVVLLQGFDTAPKQMLTPKIVGIFPDFYPIHYEYYQALIGHLLSYAADRIPRVSVAQPATVITTVDRVALNTIDFSLNSTEVTDVDLEFVLRHAQYGTVHAHKQKAASLVAGTNTVTFQVQSVPAGSYFADLWIRRTGKVISYGSVYVQTTSKSHISEVSLSSEAPAREELIGGYSKNMEQYSSAEGIHHIGKDDPISGTVTVARPQAGQAIEIGQWDIYGRMVSQNTFPLRGGNQRQTVSFQLAPPPLPLSVAQHLEINLIQQNRGVVLDHTRQAFFYRDLFPARDDIRAVLFQYYGGDSYLNLLLARQLKQAGFDTWLNQPYDINYQCVGAMLLAGLHNLPYVYDDPVRNQPLVYPELGERIVRNQYGYVRQPCLTDPQYRILLRKVFRQAARTWSLFATPEYDLGSESALTTHVGQEEVCFSETCNADFRRYIQSEYGSLDRLNQEYGTSYSSWEEIIPVDFGQAVEMGTIPLWIDHRRHMDDVWASYFAIAKETIERAAPGARVGYSASNDPGHTPHLFGLGGSDFWKLAQVMNVNHIYYYAHQLDCIRDFSAPGSSIGGGVFGGYRQMRRADREPLHHRWWIWNTVLRGANLVSVWQGSSPGTGGYIPGTTIAPDFSPYDFMSATVEELKRLKEGLGKLLLNYKRDNDGIAVLYSRASMLYSNFIEGFPEGWHIPASVSMLFPEAGFQYQMISSEQLEDGVLAEGDFRLLYLPYSQALSPDEIKEILQFAENGGSVVADVRPGLADQHGKSYAEGALDKLFGVSQDTIEASAVEADVILKKSVGALKGALPGKLVDASLSLSGAQALGMARSGPGKDGTGDFGVGEKWETETPVIIVNRYGKGRGILLNMDLSDTLVNRLKPNIRFGSVEKATFARRLIQGVFAMVGVKPVVESRPAIPGCHFYHFSHGQTTIIGILWDAPEFMPGGTNLEIHGPKGQRDRDTINRLAGQSESVAVRLAQERHVYDMLTGDYLGHHKQVACNISRGRVQLLAAIPYPIHSVEVKLPQIKLAQGAPLAYTISVRSEPDHPSFDLHVFRLELKGPDGQVVEHYLRNVNAEAGKCRGQIHLSLNEKPGTWTLSATDVSTQVKGTASFSIGN